MLQHVEDDSIGQTGSSLHVPIDNTTPGFLPDPFALGAGVGDTGWMTHLLCAHAS